MKSLLNHSKPLSTIFFGGGTPSLMPPEIISKIIDKSDTLFGFTNDVEITTEANPTSVDAQNLSSFQNSGVNRISIGVQSLNDEILAFLGRSHSSDDALRALEKAQSIFDRISIENQFVSFNFFPVFQ